MAARVKTTTKTSSDTEAQPRGASGALSRLALPVALVLVLVAALVVVDPGARFVSGAPPVEDITFERVALHEQAIVLTVRNAAATEVTIAQVLVDDAYWAFTAEPSATLGRFDRATLTLDYPWMEGEAHVIALVTQSGTVFDHEIPVAVMTPQPSAQTLWDYALIGILVGVVPVAVGMLFYPALRRAGDRHTNAVLALTLGVLSFLAIDTVAEGIELAEALPGAFQGLGILTAAALVAVLGVLAMDRALRRRGAGAAGLAILIALGIGIHNLGEGLLIGGAFALGSLTLGTILIMGFALHNVTEGPAIVAPLTRGAGLPWGRFALLAAIAGVPTIFGAWLGAFTAAGLTSVIFFGLGAGAIVVVLVQVGGAMHREEGGLWTPLNLAAFAGGFLVMLATAFLLAA